MPTTTWKGRGDMIKAPISLQDLRRRIYAKAKAEPAWRFWGLYVHVCKMETLREAYALAKKNNGAPGVDGLTFEAAESAGVEMLLTQIRDELVSRTYRPTRNRRVEIPKDGGKVRVLSVPIIRDRVVQGALKLILEPVFEADFQSGSFGYRPRRTAHEAVNRVTKAIIGHKTRVIDIDLRAYFDNVRHHLLLKKVALRVNDPEVMNLLKMILKASGKKGVPQGGVISPLLSNLYLNEVDLMLERAKEATVRNGYEHVEYARYADDLVVLIDGHHRYDWLLAAVWRRLQEELSKLQVSVNEEKTRIVNLANGETFNFLGFNIRRVLSSRSGKWWVRCMPRPEKRAALLARLKAIFKRHVSQPVGQVIEKINPILRGWVNYFAFGNASRCFTYLRTWVDRKVRRHLARSRGTTGFGWKRWSRRWLVETLGMFDDFQIRRRVSTPPPKVLPGR
jgi:RNA-directed DNA polymerase